MWDLDTLKKLNDSAAERERREKENCRESNRKGLSAEEVYGADLVA